MEGEGRGEGISLESKHIATGRPLVCLSHCISQDCDHTPSGPNVCLVCAVITREAGDEEEEEEEEEEGGNRVSTEGEGVFPLAGWVDDRQSRIILISRRDDSESERGDPRLCASVRIGEAINQTTARERWCRTPSLTSPLPPSLSHLPSISLFMSVSSLSLSYSLTSPNARTAG